MAHQQATREKLDSIYALMETETESHTAVTSLFDLRITYFLQGDNGQYSSMMKEGHLLVYIYIYI